MRKYNTEEEKKAAKKAAYKKWRESHLEQERERNRRKNAARREETKEYNKKYRAEHKEYYREYMKKWEQEHKEERKLYAKTRGYDKYNKVRRASIVKRANALSQDYRYADTSRGFDTGKNVDGQWIENNIFTVGCIYCGDTDWRHLGCDRIDNNLPHTQDNVVCSCGICNVERAGRRMSVEEFIEYRKKYPRDAEELSRKRVVVEEVNGVKVLKKR